MKLKPLSVPAALALMVAVSACQKSSPTRPTGIGAADASIQTVTDAKTGITLTTPQLVTPADGQRFRFTEQPLTLTVKNAVSTGSTPLTYTFQVATDSGFGSVVFSKDDVGEGSTGQTSLKIDKLGGNKDYFWRARVNSGTVEGLFSKGRTFNVGPEVVLQAPVPAAPANNGQAGGSVLTLTVSNADRTGPAGQIVYRFELSESSSFATLVAAVSVTEQPGGQTTAQISGNLVANATYFWRAQATDPSSGITGPYSAVFSFTYVPFDMRNAIIHNSPLDMGGWREGAKITSVVFSPESIRVDFDRRDGPNRWPDIVPRGFEGSLQYTLGMCLNINSQWHCSAVVQFWFGRTLDASAPPSQIAQEWFFDPARWAPMTGHQPAEGETVGMFVCEGNCRNNTDGSDSPLKERSNVALVPFTVGFASFIF